MVILTTGIMFPIHVRAILGVGDFTKVVSVGADRLCNGRRLPKV
jgi:hypothetical protein